MASFPSLSLPPPSLSLPPPSFSPLLLLLLPSTTASYSERCNVEDIIFLWELGLFACGANETRVTEMLSNSMILSVGLRWKGFIFSFANFVISYLCLKGPTSLPTRALFFLRHASILCHGVPEVIESAVSITTCPF